MDEPIYKWNFTDGCVGEVIIRFDEDGFCGHDFNGRGMITGCPLEKGEKRPIPRDYFDTPAECIHYLRRKWLEESRRYDAFHHYLSECLRMRREEGVGPRCSVEVESMVIDKMNDVFRLSVLHKEWAISEPFQFPTIPNFYKKKTVMVSSDMAAEMEASASILPDIIGEAVKNELTPEMQGE